MDDSIFSTGTILGTFLVLILTVIYYWRSLSKYPENYPPMPGRRWPIAGHAPFLKPNPAIALKKWYDKYGDIVSFYIGGQLYVSLNTYETIYEAFVKQADIFSDRPIYFGRLISETDAKGKIIGFGSPDWKEHRSVSVAILKSYGMGKNFMGEKILEEVNVFLKVLSEFKGEPRDIQLVTNAAVSNVIVALLLNERFDYEDKDFLRMIDLLGLKVRLQQTSSILSTFPWLMYLPGDLFGAKKIRKVVMSLKTDFSERFIDKFKYCLDDPNNDNFITSYMKESRKRQASGTDTALNDESLITVMDLMFLAGTETSSTTILWALVFAMNFPDIQQKVYEEIKSVSGTESIPAFEDRVKLPYFDAFIKETQRLGSIVPMGALHLCIETTTVGGYTIPKGTAIIANLDTVLMDKKTWGDPMTFRPERFLDKDGNLNIPDNFVPFSIGRRDCLGQSLAQMELFLFLSAIFQRFEILPEESGKPPAMEPVYGLTRTPKPFNVRLKERIN